MNLTTEETEETEAIEETEVIEVIEATEVIEAIEEETEWTEEETEKEESSLASVVVKLAISRCNALKRDLAETIETTAEIVTEEETDLIQDLVVQALLALDQEEELKEDHPQAQAATLQEEDLEALLLETSMKTLLPPMMSI